ncbi:extracellular solute-binding protein [Cellulosimicrobium cellulans]|uniref:extracellular solute-binding protein n=1 Tax=Cellulosimicrobium cellulans TaxID=1710 RepID=UPI0036F00245
MRLSTGTKAAAIIASAALLMTACSPGGSDTTGGGSSEPVWDDASNEYVMEEAVASGEAALTVWVEYPEYGEALKSAFELAHPGTRLDYEVVAKVEALDRMSLDGEAGSGADVFTTNYDDLAQAIDSSVAAPLGRYSEIVTERVGEDFASVVTRDDAMYGVPISTESIALFYNKTLLQELTGSPDPATTWEEIATLASTYNDPAVNRWTIRFLAGEMYYAYPVLSSLGWSLYPDGDLADPSLDSPKLTPGLEYYSGLRDIWDVNSADATYDFIENEFVKGETPYVITGPWTFADFDAAAEANGFEYGVTTLPQVDGGEPAASLAGMGVGIVSGYSEYPAAARVLANFMASPEGAAALYSSTGSIPAVGANNVDEVEGLATDAHAAGIIAQSQNADFVAEIPEYMYTAGNELVTNVWDRVLDVPTAQERAVKSYNELRDLTQ